MEATTGSRDVRESISICIPGPASSLAGERTVSRPEQKRRPIAIRSSNIKEWDVEDWNMDEDLETPELMQSLLSYGIKGIHHTMTKPSIDLHCPNKVASFSPITVPGTPRALLDGVDRFGAAVLSVQDTQSIACTGHLHFASGSYRVAHDLYNTVLQVLLRCVPRKLHLLVSAAVNVARSSYDAEQLSSAKLAIEKLLHDFEKDLRSLHTTEFTLRAHLADVLRKMDQPRKAAEQCEYAIQGVYGWGYDSANVPKDIRAPAFLLNSCSLLVAKSFKKLPCLETTEPQDEAWRHIFTWCAARLLDGELHQALPTVIRSMRHYVANNEDFTRELGTVVFCHIWATYVTEDIHEPCEDVSECVNEIRELMGISAAEVLATASLALTSLAPTWLWDCLQDDNAQWSIYTPQLLRHIQEHAMILASVHCNLMRALLSAYAIINTAHTPSPTLEGEYVSAFLKEHSAFSLQPAGSYEPVITPRGNEQNGSPTPLTLALRRLSLDPTLSSTPRSSKSSGYASMLSLQRRTAWKIAGEEGMDGIVWSRPERDSSANSSLRHQYSVSIASYRTLSTDDSGSWRGSAMEWEPAASTLEACGAF